MDEVQQLLDALARTPAQIAELLEDVPSDRIRLRPSPEEFSALESICHLRNIEVDGYTARIDRILNESNPMLFDIDGARLAIERDYKRQELNEALESFTIARQRNVRVLQSLDKNELNRKGTLEGVGEVTMKKLLEMMIEHDEGHLDELRRFSRLTKSATEDPV